MPTRPYPSWQRRHEAVLEYFLANPAAKQKDAAKVLGYSPSHISRIMCSPDFWDRYMLASHEAQVKAAKERYLRIRADKGRGTYIYAAFSCEVCGEVCFGVLRCAAGAHHRSYLAGTCAQMRCTSACKVRLRTNNKF